MSAGRERYMRLEQKLGREPTDDEMADECASEIDRAYEQYRVAVADAMEKVGEKPQKSLADRRKEWGLE